MLDEILTTEDGNYRVVAEIDDNPENPRHGENVGVMICGHRRYDLGDTQGALVAIVDDMIRADGTGVTTRWLYDEQGVRVMLPLYLYDHSGLSMSAGPDVLKHGAPGPSSDWDSGFVGIIFATKDTAEGLDWANVEEILRAEVRDYDLFLRGEVYDLRVQMKVVQHITTVSRYPAGSEEVHQSTVVTWVDLDDQPHATVYGDAELGMIAADLLSDCLV